MKKKFLNVGIVGCGRVFNHYVKILNGRKKKDFKITAVCDQKKKLAIKASKIFKCEYFLDYNFMLKKYNGKLDLVIILTPSGSHFKHSLLALKKGFNVLCEKPATMIPEDAIKLKKLAFKNKLIFGIAFQNRFNKSVLSLKKLFEKKNLERYWL